MAEQSGATFLTKDDETEKLEQVLILVPRPERMRRRGGERRAGEVGRGGSGRGDGRTPGEGGHRSVGFADGSDEGPDLLRGLLTERLLDAAGDVDGTGMEGAARRRRRWRDAGRRRR